MVESQLDVGGAVTFWSLADWSSATPGSSFLVSVT